MGYCYLATNEINEKCYVGYTIGTMEQRRSRHLFFAFKYNSQFIFYKALRKYGSDAFHWQIVWESDSVEELKKREIMLIQLYNSHYINGNGYNMTLGGEGTNGHRHTNEFKKKCSIKYSGEGNPMYGSNRTGNKNPMYGKKHSIESINKNKISQFENAKGYRKLKGNLKRPYQAYIKQKNKCISKSFETEQEAINQRIKWEKEIIWQLLT